MSAKPIDPRRRPPHNPPMEARLASLETHTQHIITNVGDLRADVRRLESKIDSQFIILAGMVIGAILGLAGLVAKGFHWF